METKVFDVLVVGAGHAGIEAAHICAQFGAEVAVVTMPKVPIAGAPCNPSVGGVGKGQVVREIDCLGGLMGKLADLSGIHYKTLNESRGYAVRSTRVQIDKQRYSEIARRELSKIQNISIIEKCVKKIVRQGELFTVTTEGGTYRARKVVMTTGTFLAGRLHVGGEQRDGGRVGHPASGGMGDLLSEVKTLPVKFKTGTPPRLVKNSIDFNGLQGQPSDPSAKVFHWDNAGRKRHLPQVSCYITYTNAQTMQIIRNNRQRSPLFNGQIKGVGPRYCPSIEDKAYRYPDRDIHHIFLEPEGLELETVYPSGVSTSLPKDAQEEFLKTIPGLENCEVALHGHAVEYDVVDTSELSLGLEYRKIPGLYFAGQINGTSGYEEAAAQGLVAGINACYALKEKGLFQLSRDESYIGVMIDDLVGQKRDEPYRLFTARNENRLYVREDNTFLRMSDYRDQLNFSSRLDDHLKSLAEEYQTLSDLVSSYIFKEKVYGSYFRERGLGNFSGGAMRLADLIKSPKGNPVELLREALQNSGLCFRDEVVETVAIGEVYRGYIERSERQLRQQKKLDRARLNMDALLNSHNISFECRERMRERMPETFGQLKKIEGIRPATLAYVSSRL